MEDSGTGDSTSEDTAGQNPPRPDGTGGDRAGADRAGSDQTGGNRFDGGQADGGRSDQGRRHLHGPARYARPALIAGAVIAVVCVALLVIIFFLDSFNATVYSVGGKSVQDATDEARAIRDTYATARLGGIIFLVVGIVLAAAGGLLVYRHRNDAGPDQDVEDGEDVDFEDLAGQ